MVKLVKSRPHLSQSVVESLLTQLHSAQDAARILMCHCLAAIAMQLPILADGMLGDLMDLYKVIGRSATDKKQELLVRPPSGEQCLMDKAYINYCGWNFILILWFFFKGGLSRLVCPS